MNCATTGLRPFTASTTQPWTRALAIHLYRRMAFGAGTETIQAALASSPTDLVRNAVTEAVNLPLPPAPPFAGRTQAQYGLALLESTLEKDGLAREWVIQLQTGGLRERMAFFWHNHFVTRFDAYESSSYTYQYQRLLRVHAVGNFREFVREIGLTPAMLVFLNGSENVAASPNENYARELYELFTLGDGNGYTQADIVETARALTGYTNVTEAWGPIEFDPATHDNGQKTIFGRTGNWGYADVIRILFEERGRQIATFIAGKIYRNFVNPTPAPTVIADLAQVLLDNDWELAPLLENLFNSEHFYDAANISTIIQGPIEHTLITYNELGVQLNGLSVFSVWAGAGNQGQVVFSPVDVAGWPGNRSWINTTSLAERWTSIEATLGSHLLFGFAVLGETARNATDEAEDVAVICRDMVNYLLPKGLQFEQDFAEALVNFKGDTPPEYFENGIWSIDYWTLPIQFQNLLRFLNRLPEFQLK